MAFSIPIWNVTPQSLTLSESHPFHVYFKFERLTCAAACNLFNTCEVQWKWELQEERWDDYVGNKCGTWEQCAAKKPVNEGSVCQWRTITVKMIGSYSLPTNWRTYQNDQITLCILNWCSWVNLFILLVKMPLPKDRAFVALGGSGWHSHHLHSYNEMEMKCIWGKIQDKLFVGWLWGPVWGYLWSMYLLLTHKLMHQRESW